MSTAGLGALMSGLSSGYMAGKQIERWNKDTPAADKKPDAAASNDNAGSTGTAVQNYAARNPGVVSAPGLGVSSSQPTVSATGAIGLPADVLATPGVQAQQPALPATADAKAATDAGSWATLAGILKNPKV